MSARSPIVQSRVDADLKEKTEEVFRNLGITPSQAIKMFYAQVALTRGIPFPLVLTKNNGGGEYFDEDISPNELMKNASNAFEVSLKEKESNNYEVENIKPIKYDDYK